MISPNERSAVPSLDERTRSYRPDTAFVMMQINDAVPELDDVLDSMKQVFKRFGITAVRSDEIEHTDAITDRILHEIETSQFLIADLSGSRPNVYYEVGYAHACKKSVILIRKKGSELHFDLANRVCRDYENMKELRGCFTRR